MQLYSKNYSSDHDEEIEKQFQSMLDDARSAYVIPKEAFENYRVKRGLREPDGSGVTAGVTRVGNAHGYIMNEGEKCADDAGDMNGRGSGCAAAGCLLILRQTLRISHGQRQRRWLITDTRCQTTAGATLT
jgi:hypothetical protein